MGLLPMGSADEYRRFAAECLKIAHAAEEAQRRALFLKMAEVWLDLARRDEANTARVSNSKEGIK